MERPNNIFLDKMLYCWLSMISGSGMFVFKLFNIFQMNLSHANILTDNLTYLMENVVVDVAFLAELLRTRVLKPSESEAIEVL